MTPGSSPRGLACLRDLFGFCVFAQAGNPRCFRGHDLHPCIETDQAEARKHTVDAILRRERAARGESDRRTQR